MIVTFYKTNLSRANRCYDKTAYDNYLANCDKKQVTVGKDVIPDVRFFVGNNQTDLFGYNYITYEKENLKYGAFVNAVRLQAITGSIAIFHSTDNWYFVHHNLTFNMHGQVVRAHVNDYEVVDGKHLPTLKNTYATPEEVFNSENIERNTQAVATNSDFRFIYIYINNPSKLASNLRNGLQQIIPNGGSALHPTGLLLCGVIEPTRGICTFIPDSRLTKDSDGNVTISEEQFVQLEYLTKDCITAICISDIPPTNTATIQKYTGLVKVDDAYVGVEMGFLKGSGLSNAYTLTDEGATGFVKQFNVWFELNLTKRILGATIKSVCKEMFNYIFSDDSITKGNTYEEYLQHIVKARSSVYNPIYFENIYISSSKWTQDTFSITLSPDFSFSVIYTPQENLVDIERYHIKTNTTAFAPDTVLDYWTQQVATQSMITAQQQKFNAIMNGVGSVVQLGTAVGSAVITGGMSEVVAGLENGSEALHAARAQSMNYKAGAGVVGAGMNAISSLANMGSDIAKADISYEIAQRQYQTGDVSNSVVVGMYQHIGWADVPRLTCISQQDTNLKYLQKQLHKYGYTTYLQLEDIYENHRRENFNFIMCNMVEVVGVPTDIATDISNMFMHGVHLWTGEVENFEVTNYQMSW